MACKVCRLLKRVDHFGMPWLGVQATIGHWYGVRLIATHIACMTCTGVRCQLGVDLVTVVLVPFCAAVQESDALQSEVSLLTADRARLTREVGSAHHSKHQHAA